MKSTKKGFTLIEILVVIGIIAVLAGIVIIAINPARQFAQARNSQRDSNVIAILNAIGQRLADNKGVWVSGCPSITSSSTIGTSGVDLGCLTPIYLAGGIPMDPSIGTAADTKYYVSHDSTTGRYTVCAPKGNEDNTSVQRDICVSR